MYTTKEEGVIMIYDLKGNAIGFIFRDNLTGKKIVMKCEEMSVDEIAELLKVDNLGVYKYESKNNSSK